MPIKITMPALSPTMEEGNLARWLVKKGDKVQSGDVIAEIETDKATMEVEIADEGVVAALLVAEGTQGVKVNTLIAVLAEEDEDLDSVIKSIEAGAKQPETAAKPIEKAAMQANESAAQESGATVAVAATPPISTQPEGRIFASPLARRLAREGGIDLAPIQGSGPRGRIIKSDIEQILANAQASKTQSRAADNQNKAAEKAAPAAKKSSGISPADEPILQLFNEGEYHFTPHNSMRKTIARRLVQSKQMVPHFYLSIDCELDNLLALRGDINAAAPMVQTEQGTNPAYKLSVNDMIIKAVALALKNHPAANVSWTDTGMVEHKVVDVAVAVAIEGGLITPIVRHAEQKTLSVISNEMKDLAKRARARKLKPEEYQGGSTSVSNMGMYGVKSFSAIINPPQSTIFAIGSGGERAIVKDGAVGIANVMNVTISADHRAVDGALAAELARTFKGFIENPVSMLV